MARQCSRAVAISCSARVTFGNSIARIVPWLVRTSTSSYSPGASSCFHSERRPGHEVERRQPRRSIKRDFSQDTTCSCENVEKSGGDTSAGPLVRRILIGKFLALMDLLEKPSNRHSDEVMK